MDGKTGIAIRCLSALTKRTSRAYYSQRNGAVKRSYMYHEYSTHISVRGLHYNIDLPQLRKVFGAYGTLERVNLIDAKNTKTTSRAQLVYEDFDSAFNAVCAMNGQELDGRILRVQIDDPNDPSFDTSNLSEDEDEDFSS